MTRGEPAMHGRGGDPRRAGAARLAALEAPAKVNLGLRIVGRRADGYHELESLFAPIDLADRLELAVEEGGAAGVSFHLEGDVPGVPADGSNLAVRAAERFLAEAGRTARVRIRLEKRVPAAAGLGGGSSDAGAVLRALASLWPGALSSAALARLALGLGADVPFFLDPRPGLVRGIGERIDPVDDLPAFALVLAHPGLPLATADVYRAYDALHAPFEVPHPEPGARAGAYAALTKPTPTPTMPPPFGFAGQGAAAVASLLENDLEPAAIRLCPPVARLRELLRTHGAIGVGLSGSGPTVFGVFEDADAARKAAGGLTLDPPAWCRVTRPWTHEAPSRPVPWTSGASPNW